MKVTRISIILFMTILAISPLGVASAQNFTYTSAYQVYNLEATEATVTVYFYNKDGSQPTTIAGTTSFTVAGNDTKSWFVLQQVSGSFDGSMVIASTKQVASISNVHGGKSGDQMYSNASYIAATSGVQTIQIPLLMQNNSGYSTWYNVMNTGSADAHVYASYSDSTCNPTGCASTITIEPGAAYTFNQFPGQETHTTAIFAGTVTAQSGETIAVTVIEENTNVLFAFNGFQSNAVTKNPVFPIINANNSGYTSSVNLKNVGGSSADVTVTYSPSKDTYGNPIGTACTETQTIPSGQVKIFALAAFVNGANSTCIAGARFVGSAKVTGNVGNQDLVAVVNQHRLGTDGSAYNGFNSSLATAKVVLPLIMDHNSNWWTGINIQNVGTSATNVSCTFNNSTVTIPSTALQPGEALNKLTWGFLAGASGLPSSYIGSATCTASTGDTMIVAIVNENKVGGTTDTFMTYEGINITP